jgi:hypothetical protein
MIFRPFSGRTIFTVISCVFTVFILANCFSPWAGDDAIIVISLGGTTGNRGAARKVELPENLYHIVTLKGPSEVQPVRIAQGKKETKITVVPGQWDITIIAYQNSLNQPYAKGVKEGVDIKVGKNNVKIDMNIYNVRVNIVNEEIILNCSGAISVNNNSVYIIPENYYLKFEAVIWSESLVDTWSNIDIDYNKITYKWYIWGSHIPIYENNRSITIYEKDYNPGKYQLMVVVLIDGKPYSREIYFIVE